MKNVNVSDVRGFLYEAMKKVVNGDIDRQQALSVTEIAQVMVDSAKVEVEYMSKIGAKDESSFLDGDAKQLPNGVVSVTRHRLAG